jgi:hypothetical protein
MNSHINTTELVELGFKAMFGDMYLFEIDGEFSILYCVNDYVYLQSSYRERILNNVKTIEDIKKLIELLK